MRDILARVPTTFALGAAGGIERVPLAAPRAPRWQLVREDGVVPAISTSRRSLHRTADAMGRPATLLPIARGAA